MGSCIWCRKEVRQNARRLFEWNLLLVPGYQVTGSETGELKFDPIANQILYRNREPDPKTKWAQPH